MTWPIDIIVDISPEKFGEIFAVNPRSVREALFSRLGIKAQTRRIGLRASKGSDRVRALYDRLISDAGKMERDLASELLRNWLFTQRAMLSDALDHFGVKHDNGLTDQDIDFFEQLEAPKVTELCQLLVPKHGREPVSIYLRYLKVPGAAEAVAAIAD
ncbi:MAG: hypothetical protein JXR83_06385 [Deltaproteobacteria bacterium]|nr:hypothetical protein [Deltaproteobacteria bacterium]